MLRNFVLSQLYPQADAVAKLTMPSVSHPRADGCWSWYGDPRAVAYNGKTYFGAVNENGDPIIGSFVQGAGVAVYTSLKTALEYDDHDNAIMLIRDSDKKILAFYTKHDNTVIYSRLSSNAEDVSTFAAESALAASISGTKYSYPNPIQLLSEANDPIYLWYRDRDGSNNAQWAYSKSTDSGATWSATTRVFGQDTSAYLKFWSNGTDRIDFASTTHPANDAADKVYHFYYTGGNYYKTDGTQIVASLPLAGTNVTAAYTAGGTDKVWIWDIVRNGTSIAIVHTFYPSNSTANVEYYYTLYNGSVWSSNSIVASGGSLPTTAGEEYYTGGICIDKADINTVYLSKKIGTVFEIWRYVTADSGSTWTGTAITANSVHHNCRPFSIASPNTDAKVIWWRGIYPFYNTYTTQLVTWNGT